MKKVVIVTPFDNYSYNVRVKYIEQLFKDIGYSPVVISSDFDHRNKCRYRPKRENLELLHVPGYKKNLSFQRIQSHLVFAKSVYNRLCDIKPDLVYCSAPPNFLFKYTSKYKLKNKNTQLIFEIGDLWPETLPLESKIKLLAFPILSVWARIRNMNLKYADSIVYECLLFKKKLSIYHPNVYSKVIYLCKEDYYKGRFEIANSNYETLRFAYVGSINNIIDIDLIVDIIKAVSKRRSAELIIIGGGENSEKLHSLCKNEQVTYHDYGIIYDETKKHEILSTCQFGLNIMKDSVAVGATMKSLEYFHEGLIILNNIGLDTTKIIGKYKCGYNISEKNFNDVVNTIIRLNKDDIDNARLQSRKAYIDLFDVKTIINQYQMLISHL